MIIHKTAVWCAAAVAVAAAAASLAGCASAYSPGTPAGPPEQSTIVVDSVPAAEEGRLYVAAADGFFKQQGLTVKVNSITGGEEGIPGLQSGKVQFVGGNYVSFMLAQIAAQHASVGLNRPRDVGQVLLGALMQDNGYTVSDVRQVIPAGGFPALMAMLRRGQVNAAWLPQPFGTMVQQEYGAVQLADFDRPDDRLLAVSRVRAMSARGAARGNSANRTHASSTVIYPSLAKESKIASGLGSSGRGPATSVDHPRRGSSTSQLLR